MKRRLRSALRVCGVSAALWLGGDRAGGFTYFGYGGWPVVWAGGQSLRYLSPTTFPPDSDPDLLIRAAMGQWSTVWGAGFQYSFIRLSEDFPVDHFDGYSDTLAVPAASLDPGTLAVTYMVNDADLWFDMDLLFCDLPDGVGWHFLADPDCEVTAHPTPSNGYSFYMVALHELGHGIGLGHEPVGDEPPGTPWFVATMNPRYAGGGPVGQNNIVELHTDDRAAARFLYPAAPQTKVDLANASYCSQGPLPGKAVPVFVEPPAVMPGEELVAWTVIENFGTVAVNNVRLGYYLSADGAVTTADTPLGDLRWDLFADDALEFSVAILIPDVGAGTYYLGSMLDDLNEVAEEYEDNNDVIYCDPFVIEQAAPSFAPLSQIVITCEQPFTGPAPLADYPVNMAPITWSLDNPQPGMTIDPATGVITWPVPVRSPFQYNLTVRATNAAGTSTQTLPLAVHQPPPAIVSIPDQATACGIDYTGPAPALTAPACMSPILLWSLIDGPAGMSINVASGVVTWPDAEPDALPYAVTIRAINAAGEDTEPFLLTVSGPNGDLDGDGHVDLTDFELFEPCLGGPGLGLAAGCLCADVDSDDHVDLSDYAAMQLAFTGG